MKRILPVVTILFGVLALSVLVTGYFPLINSLLYGSLLVILVLSLAAGTGALIKTIKGYRSHAPIAAGGLIVTAAMAADMWRVTGGGTDTGTYAVRLITPMAGVIFTVLLYRHISRSGKPEEKKQAPGRSQLKGIDTVSLEASLKRLMAEEKIYRSDALTLQGMAEHLDVSIHQLSEYLNRHLEQNFNSFINSHRISEAKEILKGEPEASIISIAYRVGFNSVSTFYDAFKKETGQKPQQYRKSNSQGRA